MPSHFDQQQFIKTYPAILRRSNVKNSKKQNSFCLHLSKMHKLAHFSCRWSLCTVQACNKAAALDRSIDTFCALVLLQGRYHHPLLNYFLLSLELDLSNLEKCRIEWEAISCTKYHFIQTKTAQFSLRLQTEAWASFSSFILFHFEDI